MLISLVVPLVNNLHGSFTYLSGISDSHGHTGAHRGRLQVRLEGEGTLGDHVAMPAVDSVLPRFDSVLLEAVLGIEADGDVARILHGALKVRDEWLRIDPFRIVNSPAKIRRASPSGVSRATRYLQLPDRLLCIPLDLSDGGIEARRDLRSWIYPPDGSTSDCET